MAQHGSGDRPPATKPHERAVSGTFLRSSPHALYSALADARSGTVLEAPDGLDGEGRLEALAASAPDLLGTHRVSWEQVFAHPGRSEPGAGLHDVVLVSRSYVHVVQRLPSDPEVALVSIAPRTRNLGLIITETRDRLAMVDAGR